MIILNKQNPVEGGDLFSLCANVKGYKHQQATPAQAGPAAMNSIFQSAGQQLILQQQPLMI